MSPDTPALSPRPASAASAEATPTPSQAEADLLARVVAARDLDQQRFTPMTWSWHGYLGPGKVTLLTSQWKSGKTSLVALLLARMQQGGQLAGLSVTKGKAFVISEESVADWRLRFAHLGICDNVDLLCWPFTAQPSMQQWLALIDTALALRQRQGCELVVIDSLASFLPAHSKNSAGGLLDCLTPLQRLTKAGMSVLLPHHPRKGKTVAGQAALWKQRIGVSDRRRLRESPSLHRSITPKHADGWPYLPGRSAGCPAGRGSSAWLAGAGPAREAARRRALSSPRTSSAA
jgi:hypothetical protein